MNTDLAPFVSSPLRVVKDMLDLAEIKSGERLYDLGCGDGRIVVTAALPPYYAKTIGIEKNENLVKEAKRAIKSFNLEKRAEVMLGDIFDYNYRDAHAITIYLTYKGNKILRSKLEDELKEKTRVVSHNYPIEGWNISAKKSVVIKWEDFAFDNSDPIIGIGMHNIYLYKMNRI